MIAFSLPFHKGMPSTTRAGSRTRGQMIGPETPSGSELMMPGRNRGAKRPLFVFEGGPTGQATLRS